MTLAALPQSEPPLEWVPHVPGNPSIFKKAECNSQNQGKLHIVFETSIVFRKYKILEPVN